MGEKKLEEMRKGKEQSDKAYTEMEGIVKGFIKGSKWGKN